MAGKNSEYTNSYIQTRNNTIAIVRLREKIESAWREIVQGECVCEFWIFSHINTWKHFVNVLYSGKM